MLCITLSVGPVTANSLSWRQPALGFSAPETVKMISQPCAWAFVVFLAWSGSVSAWGYQGHEVIGSIAMSCLGRMPNNKWQRF